jgi:hypothetical protein
MHALMNPPAESRPPVAKRMRTVSITKNGRELFKLDLPVTQQPAAMALPFDDGATTGVSRQDVPSQRVTVFGRVMPEAIGNARDPVAVEDAERKTSSGLQNDSIQAIKAAWAKPLPYLR